MFDMTKIVKSITDGEKTSRWSLEDSVEMFRATEQLQNWVLWKAKEDLVFGEFEQFSKLVNLKKDVISRRVRYFEAKKSLSVVAPERTVLSEAEALEIENDETNPLHDMTYTTYHVLKGETPEEKLSTYEEAKAVVGKEKPSREDLRMHSRAKRLGEKENLSIEEAMEVVENEFEEDYLGLGSDTASGSISMLTIGVELMKYSDSWKKIYKELSKVSHPDLDGDKEVQQFVNWLNELFKDRRKHIKKTSKHKDMTSRIVELMGED